MKPLTDALKKMLNGLASADAGEYLTPRQKAAFFEDTDVTVVNATDEAPVLSEAAATASTRRRIAMYMGSELPASIMNYVIETCSSLEHDLTVLTFESNSISNALLEPYTEILTGKGIEMQIVKLSGEPIPGLARYLRSHPEIAFMACKDTGYLGRSYMNSTQAKNALPVPVVVVVTQPGATVAQPTVQEEGKTGTA
ncbi:MAG: hypothetical protein WBO73_02110 [Gammaproteobacteria bacterium]|jgi:hypothetical protein